MSSAAVREAARRMGVVEHMRGTVRLAGRMTSPARMLPAYLIVGAQRCGTTSLHKVLGGHPAVVAPLLHKGVHYYDVNYTRGFGWYRGHFPLSGRRARMGTSPITGEGSPYYLFHPDVARRIAHDLPDVKIIAMLRDPVERAYSAYTHEFARGFETETFERALQLEPERLAGAEERLIADPAYVSPAHQHQAYLHRGHYAEQIDRYRGYFPAAQILVLDSARYFEFPEAEFPRVLDFLGLPKWQPERYQKANARPRSVLDPRLRRRLEEYFEPHDLRLAELLGEVPSWRR